MLLLVAVPVLLSKWNNCAVNLHFHFFLGKNFIVHNFCYCFNRIQSRHVSRVGKDKAPSGGSTQGEKIGYVSRQNVSNMKASGLVSAGMAGGRGKKQEELDEESADGLREINADAAEIDDGVDEISGAIDRLHGIASHMKDEVSIHN